MIYGGKWRCRLVLKDIMQSCVICLADAVLVVACPYCQVTSHPECVQDHLLNTVLEPHCPSCQKEWSLGFLADFLPKAWRLRDYKHHREAVLLDRQKALLPDTQEAAAEELRERRRKAHNKFLTRELTSIRREKKVLGRRLNQLIYDKRTGVLRGKTMEKFDSDIKNASIDFDFSIAQGLQINEQISSFRINGGSFVDRETGETVPPRREIEKEEPRQRRQFIRACPTPECRGFLSTAWKCNLCSVNVCSHCGDLNGAADVGHTCNPDTLACFAVIRSESKPCPTCGVPIIKLDGCDHMFCVDCKTSFHWKTMVIHPDGNSNPLYWQWMQTRVERGDIIQRRAMGCADPRSRLTDLQREIVRSENPITLMVRYIDILQAISHMREIDMDKLNVKASQDRMTLLRVKYLLNEITEEGWKIAIQSCDMEQRRCRQIVDVLELYTTGVMDIFEELLGSPKFEEVIPVIIELMVLCNLELEKIDEIFGKPGYRFTTIIRLELVSSAKSRA